MTALTIAYMTNRRDPRIEWFFDSLAWQARAVGWSPNVIVVDFYADEPGRRETIRAKLPIGFTLTHVPPKPTVWQGPHRLTSRDYFAASNARNTAVCLAPDGWIAYVDDLSVLLPGWLERAFAAVERNQITAGSYEKVYELRVHDGHVVGFRASPQGRDTRYQQGSDTAPVRLGGGAMYGCSVVMPVEALLAINGWDEDCDSMGSEDSICGLMLEFSGWEVYYDRRMRTFESEEAHYFDKPFLRIIKNSPADASWAMLDSVRFGGRHRAPNYFGPDGLRGLRARVQAGEPFPIMTIPEHHWCDGQPIREM